MILRKICLSAFVVLLSSSLSVAQTYPTKIVRIIVPAAPGGGLDIFARAVAERLTPKWGHPVIVENKPGASTILGATQVAKAAPDGHTLLLTNEQTITSNPFLLENLPYDARRDLTPISQLISVPQLVVAHEAVPANSMKELVELARKESSKLVYASYGSGSLPHLLFEGLNKVAGTNIAQVPYKGIVPAFSATAAGEAQLTLVGVSRAQQQMQAGRIKPLAVLSDKRLPELPQVMTVAEAGFGEIDPGVTWFGLFLTSGSPSGLPEKIAKDVAEIFADPAMREKYVTAQAMTPIFSTPQAFGEVIAADMRRMENLVKLTGVKGEQ
ncbi:MULTISPECIES: tripartite tricarboxylate transporter substrate-binding protein [unclassified Beijerinckia]|uniref:Bug family tripartite tricarboxylate transporter substrate binding protein n=1 Tax=unclassified Beijerinckia TaxID=2638183 RepID=UPI000897C12B|nr:MULTISPECIES: tripartite tricarboxylate transporter substrate-binding protein [unclassified Beijerinckia]MDH7797476.1 tripartite-type tricarboxylate transporter receptor subunit TctC [Beijerinckia sp. GAS462]SEC87166.1 Tripartite-type tricarboxylate transporter, receptor component TctC [Beijerinckia sp. 28-YEA-48]